VCVFVHTRACKHVRCYPQHSTLKRLRMLGVAAWCSVLQRFVERCSVLQRVAARCSALQCVSARCSALQRVAARCSALQCVAVRCSVSQCVALRCLFATPPPLPRVLLALILARRKPRPQAAGLRGLLVSSAD